jgi:alpha-galactosidase
MKIVVIGAGSASFGPGILQDAIHAGLPGATLVLVDLHAERLATMTALAQRMNMTAGAGLFIESTTDRREALPGADVVLTSIAVERLPLWQQDYEVPLRYGFRQVLGENGGPGGLFHTLRNVPIMLAICQDMEDLCPDAWLLNYTNPESRICLAVHRYTSIKAVGLCHGFFMGKGTIADITGLPQEMLEITAAGLNHFLWMTACTNAETGEDLYPLVRKLAKEKPADYLPLSRQLLQHFGLFPFPSDDHVGEYLGFAWDACLHHGYDFTGATVWNAQQTTAISEMATGQAPLDEFLRRSSGECAFAIIKALHGEPVIIPAVNVPNDGSISNLPDDALVEVPARVSPNGVEPLSIGALPEPIAALCRTQAAIQSLAVEAAVTGSRATALQALLLDPVVTNADAAVACLDEMLALQARYLPQFAQAGMGRKVVS